MDHLVIISNVSKIKELELECSQLETNLITNPLLIKKLDQVKEELLLHKEYHTLRQQLFPIDILLDSHEINPEEIILRTERLDELEHILFPNEESN